ncbi:MAG: hypothetical protein WC869_13570 [Phycisphaerae bacterium]
MRSDGPPPGATVRLTEGEIRASNALAAARAEHRNNTVQLGFQGLGLAEGHRLGTYAELAVAKLLHVWPQIGIDDRKDIPNWDLQLADGRSIEVKFRRPFGADFALNNNRYESFNTDFGVLTWSISEGEWTVAGYMTNSDFMTHAYEKNLGRGYRLCYPSAQLRDIRELNMPVFERVGIAA